MRKKRLTVVSLIAMKGGAGKTTLATAFAVRAARESSRVAMLDCDAQGSLASWWNRRPDKSNPKFIEAYATSEAIELLISEGWDWVFLDGPPQRLDFVEPVVASSDVVVVPIKPGFFDAEQANIPLELCQEHGKVCVFILNMAPAAWKLTRETHEFLKEEYPSAIVLEPRIATREAFARATALGRTGAEIDVGGPASSEIDEAWTALREAIRKRVR